MSKRPADLPDYGNPPLDEVVLGVQFDPPQGYNNTLAGEVWSLFAEEFPNVQELQGIPPQFEVFGREGNRSGSSLKLESGPPKLRLWFSSQDDNHLIQFQEDRLLLNWRRRPNGAQYPRFEGTSASFSDHLNCLKDFFAKRLSHQLTVNQAEISYINILPVDRLELVGKWLSFVDIEKYDAEGFVLSFTEVIRDEGGKPLARLYNELASATLPDSKSRAYRLGFTFRGNPMTSETGPIIDFLSKGRQIIVSRFDDLTTEQAHKAWGKF